MKNQIVGVKFLHTQNYQDLLNTRNLVSLTVGKTYAYLSIGFDIQINDLVIVPNSGYNETPVVPAVVTSLNYEAGSNYVTKPLIAVIPQAQLQQLETVSANIYQQIQNKLQLEETLNRKYEQAIRMKKLQKMAKTDPEIAALLDKLKKQDDVLNDISNSDDIPIRLLNDLDEDDSDDDGIF